MSAALEAEGESLILQAREKKGQTEGSGEKPDGKEYVPVFDFC
jgi:hypothetical protein